MSAKRFGSSAATATPQPTGLLKTNNVLCKGLKTLLSNKTNDAGGKNAEEKARATTAPESCDAAVSTDPLDRNDIPTDSTGFGYNVTGRIAIPEKKKSSIVIAHENKPMRQGVDCKSNHDVLAMEAQEAAREIEALLFGNTYIANQSDRIVELDRTEIMSSGSRYSNSTNIGTMANVPEPKITSSTGCESQAQQKNNNRNDLDGPSRDDAVLAIETKGEDAAREIKAVGLNMLMLLIARIEKHLSHHDHHHKPRF